MYWCKTSRYLHTPSTALSKMYGCSAWPLIFLMHPYLSSTPTIKLHFPTDITSHLLHKSYQIDSTALCLGGQNGRPVKTFVLAHLLLWNILEILSVFLTHAVWFVWKICTTYWHSIVSNEYYLQCAFFPVKDIWDSAYLCCYWLKFGGEIQLC